MHGCNYGADVSSITQCNEYITREDYQKLKKPITRDRAVELLNAVLNHMSVAERNDDVIKTLLSIGFTEDELVVDFNFCREDIQSIIKEMEAENEDA